MVTHNVENALRYGSRTLVMSAGKVLCDPEGRRAQVHDD
jgi:ABC-type uncharacterized transport system ATPase component